MAALMWVKGAAVSGLSGSDRRSALPQALRDPRACQKHTGSVWGDLESYLERAIKTHALPFISVAAPRLMLDLERNQSKVKLRLHCLSQKWDFSLQMLSGPADLQVGLSCKPKSAVSSDPFHPYDKHKGGSLFEETLLCLSDEVIMRVLCCWYINTSWFLHASACFCQFSKQPLLWRGYEFSMKLISHVDCVLYPHIDDGFCRHLLLLLFTLNYYFRCHLNMMLMIRFGMLSYVICIKM